jgi:TRAP-type mannitol/chloroaromatic compound transport system substrate-binding protein
MRARLNSNARYVNLTTLSAQVSRRSFLNATTAAAAGTLAGAPAVHAQPIVRWRLASAFPRSLEIIFSATDTLARLVSQASNGRFHISVSAEDELAPMPQMVEQVQAGQIECAHTFPAYYFGKDETFALDGAVPFGLTSRQMNAWVTEGNGLKLMRDFYRGYNIVNFPLGNTGAQLGGWYRKEIKSVADLNGLKMRSTGFAGRVGLRMGVQPQNVKPADLYGALEKGTIDAVDWYAPVDDAKMNFQRVAPFCYFPSWWEGGSQMSLYVNAKAWEALPADFKAILEMASARAHLEMQARYDARNPQALRTLLASGARLNRFPAEVLNAAFKAASEYYAELSASNANWKKVFDDWSKYRSDAFAWSRVSDGAFEQMMQGMRL